MTDAIKRLTELGFLEHEAFVHDMLDGNAENKKTFDEGIKIVGGQKNFYELVYSDDSDKIFKSAFTPEEYKVVEDLAGMYRTWLFGQFLKHDEMFPDNKILMDPKEIKKKRLMYKQKKLAEAKRVEAN